MERPSGRSLLESSLEVKCLFIFGAALAFVITISFLLYYQVTKSQLATQNPLMGKLTVEREFLLLHLRVLLNNDAKTESSPTIVKKPSADEKNDLDEFIRSMTIQSEKIGGAREETEFIRRLIRVRNNRPGADDLPHDDFEKKLVQDLLPIPSPDAEAPSPAVERVDKNGVYYYYMPLRMRRACVNCHCIEPGEGTMNLGTLLGIIEVTIPKPPAQKEITRLWALLLGTAIVSAFLFLIAFYLVIRFVVSRPLRKLREVSEAISRGDSTLRADFHTGDEFEALGQSFNKMLRHLVEIQDELQAKNIELEQSVGELGSRNFQLEQINRVKSDFMATMTHELKTPLNSIIGFSEVLATIESLTTKQRHYVDNINKSGHSLLLMINDILDTARLDAGRMEIQLSDFAIDDIIMAQCDMAKPLVDKKNIDLLPDIEKDLPLMRQDATRIQQVVNNLLSNAIKFTPEGGIIKIEARRIDHIPFYTRGLGTTGQTGRVGNETTQPISCIQLKVIDSGVGISPDDQEIIFQKFRQGKSSSPTGDLLTREHSGSGLGLSIVKEICKLLEGEVTLESQAGFGSTFTVTLPCELNPPERSESPLSSEIQKFAQSGTTRKNPV